MKAGTVKIQLDFMGNPFIVDACTTDGTDTKQSTADFLREEIENIGLEDTLPGDLTVDGIYEVSVRSWVSGWECPEYEHEVIFTLIEELAK